MLTLSRSVGREGVSPDPLPSPFQSWADKGLYFHRASVSMLFGVSGSFKTTIALNAVVNMGIPTLVFSTDSDRHTVSGRLVALASGQPYKVARKSLRTHPEAAREYLRRFDFIRWDFNGHPDMDYIWNSMHAHRETEGRFPEQVVVDILSMVSHPYGDGEWGSQRELMKEFHAMGRETEAHILVLTHGNAERSKRPCPRKADIEGKLDKLPEVIISSGLDYQGNLRVAIPKNRHGPSDPDANEHFPMALDAARSYVGDWVNPEPMVTAGWWQNEEEDDG